MKKYIWIMNTHILLLATLVFVLTFVMRWSLPYNEEGRYFDEASLTVYKQQSRWVYGFFAITGIILTRLSFLMLKREKNKKFTIKV